VEEVAKATLEFDLPEEHNEFEAAFNARKALSALWEIDQHCRSILKYGEPTKEQAELAQAIREMIPTELLDI